MNKAFDIKTSDKIKLLTVLVSIALLAYFAIPTLSRLKHRTEFYEVVEWDGNVSSSYRSGSGSESDPFIISNGGEFAFFLYNLRTTNYTDTYFKIDKDIVLNKGLFASSDGDVKYIYKKNTYNLNDFNIKQVETANEFNGHLDGNSHRIYGLYINSEEENVSLFNNLNGNISNLYLENFYIKGNNVVSGLAINTNGAKVSNSYFNGYITATNNKNYSFDLEDITDIENGSIDLTTLDILGNIESANITGINNSDSCSISLGEALIESGEFDIALTSYDSIDFALNECEHINLSGLKYNVVTDYKVASGLIVNAADTNISNVSNKTNIKSNYSSGFIFDSNNNVIKNSYFVGDINSNIASGFINNEKGNTSITNSYVSGDITSNETYAFVNNIEEDSSMSITSSFTTLNEYTINNNLSTDLDISNSYVISDKKIKNNNSTSDFTITTESNLKTKSFIEENLSYKEYDKNNINNDHIWLFEEDRLPILYIDDLNSDIASINVSVYSWDNLSNDLNVLNFSNKFIFKINTKELSNIKNVYYYISDSLVEDLSLVEWNDYTNIVEVKEDGTYIIYAKIVLNDDEEIYMNSDILTVGALGSVISANINNKEFNTLSSPNGYIYLPSNGEVNASVNAGYADKDDVKYYISDTALNEEEIAALSEEDWTKGTKVTINFIDPKIVYFKVLDKNEYTTYINTDYIVVKGYNMSDLTVGRNLTSGNNLNITDKSSIKFNISFEDENTTNSYNHKLVFSKELPIGTIITLIDKNDNKVYLYKTNESETEIALTSFEETGKLTTKSYYTEKEVLNNNFDIILDFKESNIEANINGLSAELKLLDNENNLVVGTLNESVKSFNIYTGSDATIRLNSDFDRTIYYNMNYQNTIPYEISIEYAKDGEKTIYDSSYEDMNYGIELSLYNNTQSIPMEKRYLNNILVKADNISYHPYNNGLIDIKLNQLTGNITIETFTNNIDINEEDDYAFKMCPFTSYDNKNYNEIVDSECIYIPLLIENNAIEEFNFDVKMDNNDRVINKDSVKTLSFDIIQMTNLTNPNIRVSLYEKKTLSAYDQSYKILDMMELVNNDNFYNIDSLYVLESAPYSTTPYKFNLSLKTNKLKYTGYKLIFELYDGDKLITKVDKKFIIKKGDE